MAPAFKRILLKLSGEALMGELQFGTDPARVAAVARQVSAVRDQGVEVAIVVGAGNIYRGMKGAAAGMDRATADYMGMLATVLNALPLQDALEKSGTDTRVQSALAISEVAEPYIRRRAMRHLEKGRVVIFAAGTGNPFFTTDTAAALRAAEIHAEIILMAKNGVEGVYTADPALDSTAQFIPEITHMEALERRLRVMDSTALALCMENGMPLNVFNMDDERSIARIISGERVGTLVASQAIPFALFALPAGVLLDRSSKLPIMLISESVQAVALGSIPAAYWMGVLSIHWMYTTAFLLGTCAVIGGGAEQIFLTFLIGREGLIDAQSKFAAVDSGSRLLAPGIAGILIQWLTAPFAVMVNAVGFVISIFNLRRISVRDPRPAPSDKHPLRDIHDGLIFIWNDPLLRTLAWGAGIWHFLFYGYSALHILFATRELGMSPGMLGTAQMLGGLGVFASSMALKPLNRRFGPGVTGGAT